MIMADLTADLTADLAANLILILTFIAEVMITAEVNQDLDQDLKITILNIGDPRSIVMLVMILVTYCKTALTSRSCENSVNISEIRRLRSL